MRKVKGKRGVKPLRMIFMCNGGAYLGSGVLGIGGREKGGIVLREYLPDTFFQLLPGKRSRKGVMKKKD